MSFAGAFRHRVAGSEAVAGGVARPAVAAATPPERMLQQGAVRIRMPIDFNLAELNARR